MRWIARSSFNTRPVPTVTLALMLLLPLLVAMGIPAEAGRQPLAAIVVDARSGKVLFARAADAPRYPASISKVMTLYLLFRELKAGRLTLRSRLRVSRHAALKPPSKLGLLPGQAISVDQAIRALAVKSANDVATVVAENLAGTEAAFARRMTRMARALGMTRTTFRNASGLPSPPNVSTARDLATLSLRLMRDFPYYYRKYFGLKHFTWRGKRLRNHNHLLWRVRGMDGIKTGYTRAAGSNLAASVRRGNRRIVAVVLGAPSSRWRNRYMAQLIERAFRQYRLTPGTRIAALAGTPPGWNPARARVLLARMEGGVSRRAAHVRTRRNFSAKAKDRRRVEIRKVPRPAPRHDMIARLAERAAKRSRPNTGAPETRERRMAAMTHPTAIPRRRPTQTARTREPAPEVRLPDPRESKRLAHLALSTHAERTVGKDGTASAKEPPGRGERKRHEGAAKEKRAAEGHGPSEEWAASPASAGMPIATSRGNSSISTSITAGTGLVLKLLRAIHRIRPSSSRPHGAGKRRHCRKTPRERRARERILHSRQYFPCLPDDRQSGLPKGKK